MSSAAGVTATLACGRAVIMLTPAATHGQMAPAGRRSKGSGAMLDTELRLGRNTPGVPAPVSRRALCRAYRDAMVQDVIMRHHWYFQHLARRRCVGGGEPDLSDCHASFPSDSSPLARVGGVSAIAPSPIALTRIAGSCLHFDQRCHADRGCSSETAGRAYGEPGGSPAVDISEPDREPAAGFTK